MSNTSLLLFLLSGTILMGILAILEFLHSQRKSQKRRKHPWLWFSWLEAENWGELILVVGKSLIFPIRMRILDNEKWPKPIWGRITPRKTS